MKATYAALLITLSETDAQTHSQVQHGMGPLINMQK